MRKLDARAREEKGKNSMKEANKWVVSVMKYRLE